MAIQKLIVQLVISFSIVLCNVMQPVLKFSGDVGWCGWMVLDQSLRLNGGHNKKRTDSMAFVVMADNLTGW